ncbi:phosphatidylinositol 3- and 4-kinase, partial [Helicosporidium sp. ATCC 50920]
PAPPAASPPRSTPLKTQLYGEAWEARRERMRLASPHGSRAGWDIRCVVVKSGDDCRQELLAMQLIRALHDIFAEAALPLFLRPYEVLVTSSRTALIELVPNAPSIHTIKARSAPGTSLRQHLGAVHGEGTLALRAAQRAFVESLAAYSLVCYLLQIKDRHNGNILLDAQGHVIHIDFGFMLSNSPGGVNFESAPFKLTRELLEVMDSGPDGRASELFDYFKVLMIQGFLAARKHSDRILLLVEMMAQSGAPCFKSRAAAVGGLRKRFHLALPEHKVVDVVLGLISESLDAWRTRQYDYYQRVLNGVL